MESTGRTFLLALGLLAFAPAAFCSELDGRSIENMGSFRVGIFGGAFLPNSVSWSGSGLLAGAPFSANGKISSHTGSSFGGLVGYGINEYLNAEMDLGYLSTTFEKFTGNISITGLGSFNGSAALSGRVNTFAGFLNLLVTPIGTRGTLTPYIGAGPGWAHSSEKLRSFSLGGMTLPVNSSGSETDFAADLVAGVDVKLMPQLELGLVYGYFWIDAKHLGSGAGIQARSGAVSGHAIGLLLEYQFARGNP